MLYPAQKPRQLRYNFRCCEKRDLKKFQKKEQIFFCVDFDILLTSQRKQRIFNSKKNPIFIIII